MATSIEGCVYFIGKPLDAVSSTTQPLSSAVTHGKRLYDTNGPSASPVTVVRITMNRIRVRVPRVAAATIRGRNHYGVCKTFAVAAAAMNLTSRELKARNSLHFCSTTVKIFRI